MVTGGNPTEAEGPSVPRLEPGEALFPGDEVGTGVGGAGLLAAADSLYAAAAWCAYVHCDTVDHGPCSSRQEGR